MNLRRHRLAGLIRSTPLRLALGLVACFALVSSAMLGFAYLRLQASTGAQIEANLDQHVAGFRVAADAPTLGTLVTAEARVADPADRIFAYIGPGGLRRGNAQVFPDATGVEIRPLPEGRALTEAGYVSRVLPMVGGILVVAESRAPLEELKRTFLRLLAFSLLPTLVLSLSAGLALARSSARRVGAMERTLRDLAGGDLTARVEDDGHDDDFARIGAGINDMAAAQEAATSALRQVSTDIAHDLKTPVQRLVVLLNDLRDRLPETGAEAEIAARAAAEADRAVGVFHSLLQIAQIEGGRLTANFAPVDLTKLAETFAEIYEPTAEESGHRLRLTPPPPALSSVRGDKGLLGQALANLIENALHHTPPGSEITLSLHDDGTGVILRLADNGPGIPAPERKKVLRRLYRLEQSRTTPGNGLGLSLVAAIAELHGAVLELADNAPGLSVSLRFARGQADGSGFDDQGCTESF